MQRRKFAREFKLEAVRLVRERGIPPASRNHLVPTGCDIPAWIAASSLLIPVAINAQNSCRSRRVDAGGRPGDRNGGQPRHLLDEPFRQLLG